MGAGRSLNLSKRMPHANRATSNLNVNLLSLLLLASLSFFLLVSATRLFEPAPRQSVLSPHSCPGPARLHVDCATLLHSVRSEPRLDNFTYGCAFRSPFASRAPSRRSSPHRLDIFYVLQAFVLFCSTVLQHTLGAVFVYRHYGH